MINSSACFGVPLMAAQLLHIPCSFLFYRYQVKWLPGFSDCTRPTGVMQIVFICYFIIHFFLMKEKTKHANMSVSVYLFPLLTYLNS